MRRFIAAAQSQRWTLPFLSASEKKAISNDFSSKGQISFCIKRFLALVGLLYAGRMPGGMTGRKKKGGTVRLEVVAITNEEKWRKKNPRHVC